MDQKPVNERTLISVEDDRNTSPLYGTVEKKGKEAQYIGGAAGTAVSAGNDTSPIIKKPETLEGIEKKPVDPKDGPVKLVKGSATEKYVSELKTTQKLKVKKASAARKTTRMAEYELTAATMTGNDPDEQLSTEALKQSLRTAAGTAGAVKDGVQGAARYRKLRKALKKDVEDKLYTQAAVKQILKKSSQAQLMQSGAKLGKSIKTSAQDIAEDWQGNDDLGIQAIIKTKNLAVRSKRSAGIIKNMRRTKKARAAARAAKGASEKAAEGGVRNAISSRLHRAAAVGKAAAMKVLIIALVVILAASALFGGVLALIPSASVKSKDEELTKTYKYITELDYAVYERAAAYSASGSDTVTYYYSGMETDINTLEIRTNIDLILLYLDLKHEDYEFDEVKSEIADIHAALYTISTSGREETVTTQITVTSPVTGAQQTVTVDLTVSYLDVFINAQSFETYIAANGLLTDDEQELAELSNEVGMYTARQELGNPFGADRNYAVSGRFGIRKSPVTGTREDHTGIDVSMPSGTEVYSVLSGTVEDISYGTAHGNTVTVSGGDKTVMYGHLGGITVTEGQAVTPTTQIGTVGASGLHLEYIKDGCVLNPSFYLTGCISTGSSITGVSWLSDEELEAFAASYGVTLPANLSEGRKNVLKSAAMGVMVNIPYHYVWRSYYSLLPGVEANNFGSPVPPDSRGRNRKGTDCSGFVCWSYYSAGIYPSGWAWGGDETTGWRFVATPGILASPSMERISASQLQPGDVGLINGTAGTADHTGVYLGRTASGYNMWLHCSGSRGAVCNNYGGFRIFVRMRGI